MLRPRVLWIEDDAETSNAYLAADVYLSGLYDLVVAVNATRGADELRRAGREFDAIIVDIRIPPGIDDRWGKIYRELFQSNKAARLGLRLLETIFNSSAANGDDFPEWARSRDRYGVLTIESGSEFLAELRRLEITVYRDKAGSSKNSGLLLEMIGEIMAQRQRRDG